MIDGRLVQNFQFIPESYCSDRMWGEKDKIVKMTRTDCSIPRQPATGTIIDCIHYYPDPQPG